MAPKAAAAEDVRRLIDWPKPRGPRIGGGRAETKDVGGRGAGRIAWGVSTAALIVGVVAAVRPVNYGLRWSGVWAHNHATTLADNLTHARHHRPGALPAWHHSSVVAPDGVVWILLALLLLVVALWRYAPGPQVLTMVGKTLAVLAVLLAAGSAIAGTRPVVAMALRALGAGANFVGQMATYLEM